jgi:hypothetical protein
VHITTPGAYSIQVSTSVGLSNVYLQVGAPTFSISQISNSSAYYYETVVRTGACGSVRC